MDIFSVLFALFDAVAVAHSFLIRFPLIILYMLNRWLPLQYPSTFEQNVRYLIFHRCICTSTSCIHKNQLRWADGVEGESAFECRCCGKRLKMQYMQAYTFRIRLSFGWSFNSADEKSKTKKKPTAGTLYVRISMLLFRFVSATCVAKVNFKMSHTHQTHTRQ